MDHHSARSSTSSAPLRGKLVVFVILLLVVTFSFFRFQLFRTDQATFATGKELLNSWDLIKAEAELSALAERHSASLDVERTYGNVLLMRGELRKADAVFQNLLQHDSIERAWVLYKLGNTKFFLGQLDSAEALARDLLRAGTQSGNKIHSAEAYHLLGRIAFNNASYDSALRFQTASFELSREMRSIQGQADALRQLGVLAWYGGRPDSALKNYYETALALYRQINDKMGEATTLSNIGLVYANRLDWESQLRYQLLAFDIRKRIGDQVGLADSYYFLHYMPFNSKSARGFHYTSLQKSFSIAKRIGYTWGEEIALRALTNYFSNAFKQRERNWDWIDSTVVNLSGEGKIYRMEAEAWRLESADKYEEAAILHSRVIRICDSLGFKTERLSSLVYYGNCLRAMRRYGEAETMYRRALGETSGQEWKKEWPASELASLDIQRGRFHEAKTTFKRLVRQTDSLYLARMRSSTPDIAFEQAVATTYNESRAYYGTLLDVLFQTHDASAFQFVEQERSMPFWGGDPSQAREKDTSSIGGLFRMLQSYDERGDENLDVQSILRQLGEVKKQAQGRQQALSSSMVGTIGITTVSQLQKVLRPDEVFLEYVVGNGRTWLMAVRRNSIESLPIEIQESELIQLVEVYRSAILRGKLDGRDSVWKAPSVRLYATLVHPAVEQKMIARDDHIIISPRSSLHLVPFHTLLTSKKTESPRFLVEDHTISYVESATQLVNLRTRPARPMETMLAVGPDGKRLPHVERELQSIPSPFFRTVKLARNGDANADVILAGMKSYSALHIAAHARVNMEFPLYSSIRAADRNIELHEIMNQSVTAQLVVLSACESGLSAGATEDLPRGADAVSFPRAFMAAGAQNVIASLWLVEDLATANLMQGFYRNLSANHNSIDPSSPSDFSLALSQAQRQFIAENRISGSKTHPFYWGAFYLVGGK